MVMIVVIIFIFQLSLSPNQAVQLVFASGVLSTAFQGPRVTGGSIT